MKYLYTSVWHDYLDEDRATHEVSLNRLQKAGLHSRVLLSCGKTSGRPYTNVTWTKNGYPVPQYVTLTNRGVLIFEKVQMTDSGRYECHVESSGGYSMEYVDLIITGQ